MDFCTWLNCLPWTRQDKWNPVLQWFSGCDVVSAFRGKGKKSAWQTWDVCDEASDIFAKLSKYPPTVEDCDMKILEKFVVTMYDRSSIATGVDAACLLESRELMKPFHRLGQLFLSMSNVLPTSEAGCIWSQSTVCQPETQSPADWGWTRQGDVWQILWTSNLPIAESCQQLTRCGCNKEGVEGANVMALVSLAQHCVAVIASCSPDLTFNLWSVWTHFS